MKLRIILVLLLGLLVQGMAWAASTEFKAGKQYNLIEPAPAVGEGQEVEVIEFFWYGCGACNKFEPALNTWLKNKPAHIRFVRIPMPFQGPGVLHAKTFYALQLLGEVDRLHDDIFHTMHVKDQGLRSLDDVVAYVVSKGVDEQKFRAAMDSFAVHTQMNRGTVLAKRYGVHSTPTMVVDGRYRSGKGFTSWEEITELMEFLADKTLKDRQTAR